MQITDKLILYWDGKGKNDFDISSKTASGVYKGETTFSYKLVIITGFIKQQKYHVTQGAPYPTTEIFVHPCLLHLYL